jgi:hypothetical protein
LISNRNCLRPKLMSQKVMTPINKYSLLNLYLIIASLISCFAVDSSFCSLRNRPRSERARPRAHDNVSSTSRIPHGWLTITSEYNAALLFNLQNLRAKNYALWVTTIRS